MECKDSSNNVWASVTEVISLWFSWCTCPITKNIFFAVFKKWSYQTHKTSVGLNVYFRCSDCFQWKVTALCIFKRILLSQSPLLAKCLFRPYYISGTIRSSWRVHLGIVKEMMQYEQGLCEWKGEIWVVWGTF